MKKTRLTIIPLILLLSSCHAASTASNEKDKTVIATYLGGEVTLKEANNEVSKLVAKNEKLKDLTFEKLNVQQQEAVVKEIVLKEMSYKEAKKRNLDKDKDYQEALKIFEGELLKQKLLLTLAKDAANEENLKKNYDEIAAKLKNKKDFRLRYIAVKTQKEAEEIYKDLSNSPNSFAAQAKKKSIDKEIAKKGGDLGFVVEDLLPKEVLQQAEKLQKGQISKPFSTNEKWVIIKFIDKRPAEILPYEKAKDALAQNLAKKAMEDFASRTLEKAQVKMLVK